MKRAVSIVLLLAMLTGLAACGAGTEDPSGAASDFQGSVTDAPVSGTEGEPAKEPTMADILPKLDFDGATVSIAMDYWGGDYTPSDELTGSAVNDAIVDRTLAVEELYNVDLEYYVHKDEPREMYVMWAETGDDTYKLYTSRTRYMGEYITNNVARSWSDYPEIIDFEADWFDVYAIDTFSVGDTVKMLYGDANESGIRYAWIWLFNKELAEQYHFPDLYQAVDDGKWTMDYVLELTESVYTDVNGNGEEDMNDVYGYVTDRDASFDSWGPTIGLSPVVKDDKNYPVVVESIPERVVNGFEKIYELVYLNDGCYVLTTGSFTQMGEMFVKNKTVFTNTLIKDLEDNQVREMVDFGVLPTPKLTEDQETYYTHTDCLFSCMLLPSAISEEEALCSVYVANALNAFSHEIVVPVYYEMVLKTRLTRDKESTRMMDLVLEGRRYGFEYFAESDFPISHKTILRDSLHDGKAPSVSTYTRRLENCKKWVANFLENWEEMLDIEQWNKK
jgi:hypothetical protein